MSGCVRAFIARKVAAQAAYLRAHWKRLVFIAGAGSASAFLSSSANTGLRLAAWLLMSIAGWASVRLTWAVLVRVAGPNRVDDDADEDGPFWWRLVTFSNPMSSISSAMGWFMISWWVTGYGVWRIALEVFDTYQRFVR
jgi:hypothetical protein